MAVYLGDRGEKVNPVLWVTKIGNLRGGETVALHNLPLILGLALLGLLGLSRE